MEMKLALTSNLAGLTGFKAKREDGNISDTMIFAELGINGCEPICWLPT
ncbi:hypothetical protein [Brevibacillus marinus]|nr:hypothetical protein [Brevibacillus marinus]